MVYFIFLHKLMIFGVIVIIYIWIFLIWNDIHLLILTLLEIVHFEFANQILTFFFFILERMSALYCKITKEMLVIFCYALGVKIMRCITLNTKMVNYSFNIFTYIPIINIFLWVILQPINGIFICFNGGNKIFVIFIL